MKRAWGKDGRLLEREDTLLGFPGVFETVVFQLRGLSTPRATVLGDCGHPVQEGFEF